MSHDEAGHHAVPARNSIWRGPLVKTGLLSRLALHAGHAAGPAGLTGWRPS